MLVKHATASKWPYVVWVISVLYGSL